MQASSDLTLLSPTKSCWEPLMLLGRLGWTVYLMLGVKINVTVMKPAWLLGTQAWCCHGPGRVWRCHGNPGWTYWRWHRFIKPRVWRKTDMSEVNDGGTLYSHLVVLPDLGFLYFTCNWNIKWKQRIPTHLVLLFYAPLYHLLPRTI